MQKGLSLLEVIVVVSILSIILIIGYPNFQREWANKDLKNSAEGLRGLLNFAQGAAIKNSDNVTVTVPPERTHVLVTRMVAGEENLIRRLDFPGGVTIRDSIAFIFAQNGTLAGGANETIFLDSTRTESKAQLTINGIGSVSLEVSQTGFAGGVGNTTNETPRD